MSTDLCTLVIGERVVAYCRDGLLEAEYALFDADDAIARSASRGYQTTGRIARERLRKSGLGPNLAREAFAALNPGRVRELVRAPSVLEVVDQLTACEAFEGGEFSAANHTYVGTWLDLRALADSCRMTGIAHFLQILHLDLLLEELADDVCVRLLAFGDLPERVPVSQAMRKARFGSAQSLPAVFRGLQTPTWASEIPSQEEASYREALLQGLRARAAGSPTARERLLRLATGLTQAGVATTRALPNTERVDGLSGGPHATTQPRRPRIATPFPEAQKPSPEAPGGSKLFEELNQLAKSLKGNPALGPESTPPARELQSSAPWKLLVPSRAELLETLPLPDGATEDMLSPTAWPRTPLQVRIAMTRLARTLGRDYRLTFETSLHTGVEALELAQQYLRRAFSGSAESPAVVSHFERECVRHGALLSELLARLLGAAWVDVSSQQPAEWAMQLPSNVRVYPIARVQRYIRQGTREADLVAFYLELEQGVRGDAFAV